MKCQAKKNIFPTDVERTIDYFIFLKHAQIHALYSAEEYLIIILGYFFLFLHINIFVDTD